MTDGNQVKLADFTSENGRRLTLSYASVLYTLFDQPINWEQQSEFQMIRSAVEGFEDRDDVEHLPVASIPSLRADTKGLSEWPDNRKLKLYTDYPRVLGLIDLEQKGLKTKPLSSRFELVSKKEDADFLFMLEHVRNFLQLPGKLVFLLSFSIFTLMTLMQFQHRSGLLNFHMKEV
jgi:hypothetical protein